MDTFWQCVRQAPEPAACWPWTRCRTGSGYGWVRWQGVYRYAHRVAWELACGPIPAGLLVRHRCDNPLCCRPEHLCLGRHADNMADMAARGRGRSRVLSAGTVALIRASERPATEWAGELGVSPTAVQMVRRGETYRATGAQEVVR